jgi:hypothetical protein
MLPAGRFRCDEDGRALRSTPPNGNGYADAANGAAVEAAAIARRRGFYRDVRSRGGRERRLSMGGPLSPAAVDSTGRDL